MKFVRALACFGSLVSLAACGGGGDSGGVIFADGSPIGGASLAPYVGKTFPVKFAYADSAEVGRENVGISTGTIRVIDAQTFELILNTGTIAVRRTFTAIPGTDDFSNGLGYELDGDLLDGLFELTTSLDPSDNVNLTGAIGFQTPESRYPTTAITVNYSQVPGSALFFINEGNDFYFRFFGGDVNLDVNFAASTISGTLFDGSALIDADLDTADDDRLAIDLTMTGTLTGGGINGTVAGSATQDIDDDGVGVLDLNLTMTNSNVDGAFYGNDAGVISGTYEGDYTFDDPNTGPSTGSLAGYFDATR